MLAMALKTLGNPILPGFAPLPAPWYSVKSTYERVYLPADFAVVPDAEMDYFSSRMIRG
ncbi:hypothetical protein [Serratia sp. 14-2641]|uniref:hypothetical protein n=1 Tax=Serratia sp. 14-2641 TaxID=1841657 RepID=UPI00130163B0|nr:hypothetical protein [Serratia sp. 14-2641]